MKRFLTDFDKKIGMNKLRLIHLNDSKGGCGCKKDRHETLTKGFIFNSLEGIESLKYLVDFCTKNKIDMVLETPDADLRGKEIQMLNDF